MSLPKVEQYAEMVAALVKPGEAILASLTPFKCDLYHMSDALAIEASELADAVKRHVIYEKDLDAPQKEGQSLRQNIVEELGDMEFYMEHLRTLVGVTREETLLDNINKLGHRYKSGTFNNADAINREDKAALENNVDVYAVQAESRASGRSFMGGTESTLCGQRYLLSISSGNKEEAEVAQLQLDYLYDFHTQPQLQGDSTAQTLESFKKNNAIAIVMVEREPLHGVITITYQNNAVFVYRKPLTSELAKLWCLVSVTGVGEVDNG